jgi:hypothetical protein
MGRFRTQASCVAFLELFAILKRRSVVWGASTPQDDASELFFEQSTQLLLLWNHLRITVHRPFVAVHRPNAASAASHAQCTHAARANARLLGICVERAGSHPSFMPHMLVRSCVSYFR